MGSMGTVGVVDVKFQASTRDVTADIKALGESIAATSAKAKEAGERTAAAVAKITAASEKARFAAMMAADGTEQALKKGTAAYSRAFAQFQREEAARRTAMGLQIDATRAAARADELAAMKAEMLASANEKLALSANPVIAKFQLMQREVSGSMAVMGEKVAATAERAELSADGIASAFGGIGKLLGVGIAGDFVAHLLDNIAELNVEMEDLHEKTGMAVQTLAGLRLMAQSKGLDFTTISMGLIRLGKAMYEAKQGMLEDREAFSSLGISMQEVNTLSVEQMLYRVSKALGENKDLVISDGTALELFGRGGKELVPMLRQWGDALQRVANEQGKLTGVTNESAAASEQWLQDTSDLTAEFHGALTPLLTGLVKHLGVVEAAFRAVDVVMTGTFGSIIELGTAALAIIGDLGKAELHVAEGHFNEAHTDWGNANSAWSRYMGTIWGKHGTVRPDWDAMLADWKSSGKLPLPVEPGGQNRPGDVDGALLKQAKQELANMEKKRPLSRDQIVAFWQKEYKKALPGSQDQDSINLILGNLGQHARGAARGAGAPDAADSRVLGLDSKSRMQEWVKSDYEQAYAKQGRKPPPDVPALYGTEGSQRDFAALDAMQRTMAALQKDQHGAYAASFSVVAPNQNKIAEASLRIEQMTGRISALGAAQAEAAIHAQEYADAMAALDEKLKAVNDDSSLTETARARKIAQLQSQRNDLNTNRQIQVLDEQQKIASDSLGVATRDALDRMVQSWTNMTAIISALIPESIGAVNESLSRSLMAHAYNGQEYRRGITQGLSNTARGIGSQVLNSGFKEIEGSVLGKFGFGPKGKLGESEGNAMWVRFAATHSGPMDAAAAKLAGLKSYASTPTGLSPVSDAVTALIGGGDSGSTQVTTASKSGWGSVASSIVGTVLGGLSHFAAGGPILSNFPAIVGENGPELFVPSSSGHIVPNDQLGGVPQHHTWNIDARGSSDPAATEAAINRAMKAWAPHIVRASTNAVHENRARRPSSAR